MEDGGEYVIFAHNSFVDVLSSFVLVLFEDVENVLASKDIQITVPDYVLSSDLLYADDTVMIGNDTHTVQILLNTLVECGYAYGLEMNWKKVQSLNRRTLGILYDPHGFPIKSTPQTIYLGSSIRADAKHSSEIVRRIGEAHQTFDKLTRIWKHTNISKWRKQYIYEACVLSKLLYSLDGICCKAVDRKKLNSFHCTCLRKIHKIPHSYISYVSNTSVLNYAWSKPLEDILLCRQLVFFGDIIASDHISLLRCAFFAPNEFHPRTWNLNRVDQSLQIAYSLIFGIQDWSNFAR